MREERTVNVLHGMSSQHSITAAFRAEFRGSDNCIPILPASHREEGEERKKEVKEVRRGEEERKR